MTKPELAPVVQLSPPESLKHICRPHYGLGVLSGCLGDPAVCVGWCGFKPTQRLPGAHVEPSERCVVCWHMAEQADRARKEAA